MTEKTDIDEKISCSLCGGPTEWAAEGRIISQWYLCRQCEGTDEAKSYGYCHD